MDRKGSNMSEFDKEMLMLGVLVVLNLYIILKDEFKKAEKEGVKKCISSRKMAKR